MIFFKKNGILFFAFIFLSFLISQPAFSAVSNYELEQRIKELEERIKKGEEIKVKEEEPKEKEDIVEKWADKVNLSGTIELDYSFADDNDLSNSTNNYSTSDLDIGTVELGLEVNFHEYVTGMFILKGEGLTSDDDRIFWDEATITVQKGGFPLYFVGGKRTQPFGIFENRLINDPITQDCYEIATTGATFGLVPGYGLDISATVYKGETLMGHLVESEYGYERDNSPTYEETNDVDSYVLNITMEPTDGLLLSLYYDSEPGDDNRNDTIGGTVHWEISRFAFDWEYIKATQREKHFSDNLEYKDSAWFLAAAFQIIDPLEIAARYEAFDDGMDGDQDGHLEDRYSVGLTYTLFEKDSFVLNLMGEYRRSNYEKAEGSTADDNLDEFFLRLAIGF
ncbi:MAG: LbtU family siderophore porin [Deltaproteobacteria bacterium]|nr:LbtU family siderophore porin [Deltaproteobacteria bacterium]